MQLTTLPVRWPPGEEPAYGAAVQSQSASSAARSIIGERNAAVRCVGVGESATFGARAHALNFTDFTARVA